MLERQWASGHLAECRTLRAVDPTEVVAIVLTALAANAFTYGALLQFHGVVTASTTALLVGGGLATLASTGWLAVLSFVKQVVGP